MKNYIAKGEVLEYTLGSGDVISSGDLVAVGKVVGVAYNDGVEGDKIALNLKGVYEVPKAAVAITQGEKLYFDATAGNVTNVAADNIPCGVAYEAADMGDAVGQVLLTGDGAGAGVNPAANVAAEATANGSDAATTQALANALKVTVNDILLALKAAGLMEANA